MQDTRANTPESSPDVTLPLHCVSESQFAAWRAAQPASVRGWLDRNAFVPERGRWTLLPEIDGRPQGVLVGLGKEPLDPQAIFWLAAGLSDRLPAGSYRLAEPLPADELLFVLGWTQGGYRYLRYKSRSAVSRRPHLEPPATLDLRYVQAATRACAGARDLINTPANDLGPAELATAALAVAQEFGGESVVVEGDALTAQFPLVAAVGRGSPRAPRLIDLHFRRAGAPRITLVGKGVCFDSGGLDIKAPAGMLLMKKDMGGAACALATAQLLQELDVPIDLRVLLPAVENSVDGNAFRPGDVWPSRKGLSVEIGNTDAEGRLVLADALACACESNPD